MGWGESCGKRGTLVRERRTNDRREKKKKKKDVVVVAGNSAGMKTNSGGGRHERLGRRRLGRTTTLFDREARSRGIVIKEIRACRHPRPD